MWEATAHFIHMFKIIIVHICSVNFVHCRVMFTVASGTSEGVIIPMKFPHRWKLKSL